MIVTVATLDPSVHLTISGVHIHLDFAFCFYYPCTDNLRIQGRHERRSAFGLRKRREGDLHMFTSKRGVLLSGNRCAQSRVWNKGGLYWMEGYPPPPRPLCSEGKTTLFCCNVFVSAQQEEGEEGM